MQVVVSRLARTRSTWVHHALLHIPLSGHYDGDDTHGPADASTEFSIDETPTAGTEHGSIQSSNNTK